MREFNFTDKEINDYIEEIPKNTLEEKLDYVETMKFYNEMIDFWFEDNYKTNSFYQKVLVEIERRLNDESKNNKQN